MAYALRSLFMPGSILLAFLTAVLFMLPLKKKEKFGLRLGLSLVVVLAAGIGFAFFHKAFTIAVSDPAAEDSLLKKAGSIFFGVNIEFILGIVLLSLFFWFCCDVRPAGMIYGAVCAYLTQELFQATVGFIPGVFQGGNVSSHPGVICLELLITFAFFFLIYVLVAIHLPRDDAGGRFPGLSAAAIFVILLLHRFLGDWLIYSYGMDDKALYHGYLFYSFTLCLFILLTQIILRQREEYRAAAETEIRIREQKQKNLEEYRVHVDSINHFCHDMKYILASMDKDREGERWEELKEEIRQSILGYESHYDTGNDALNVLLTDADRSCRKQGIHWTCMADGKVLRFMESVDLFTMLGNALENAMENAALAADSDQKFVSVVIRPQNRMASIRIDNYCETMPVFKHGIPLTTKPDAKQHGYGVRSIISAAERYGGIVRMSAADHVFSLTILIPVRESS